VKRAEITSYLDDFLRIGEIEDASLNGLQVEGAKEVACAAFAVDACLAACEQAVEAGAQLLLVHHGLFWGKPFRLVGPLLRRVKTLIEGDCSLYAAHRPLDIHPEVGNNIELARQLGLGAPHPFGQYQGSEIGVTGTPGKPLPLGLLVERFAQATGHHPVRVLAHGPKKATHVACVSGDAADLIDQIANAGFDTLVTGETSHAYYHQAAEYGMNVIYGGHYVTETLGIKALASHLEDKFDLETVFLDIPTGM
jgi:dinuclear metal center YbgI/SA1388 family protein